MVNKCGGVVDMMSRHRGLCLLDCPYNIATGYDFSLDGPPMLC